VILFLLAVVVLFLCVTGAKIKNKNMQKLIKCSVPLVLFVALMLCMSKTVEPYCNKLTGKLEDSYYLNMTTQAQQDLINAAADNVDLTQMGLGPWDRSDEDPMLPFVDAWGGNSCGGLASDYEYARKGVGMGKYRRDPRHWGSSAATKRSVAPLCMNPCRMLYAHDSMVDSYKGPSTLRPTLAPGEAYECILAAKNEPTFYDTVDSRPFEQYLDFEHLPFKNDDAESGDWALKTICEEGLGFPDYDDDQSVIDCLGMSTPTNAEGIAGIDLYCSNIMASFDDVVAGVGPFLCDDEHDCYTGEVCNPPTADMPVGTPAGRETAAAGWCGDPPPPAPVPGCMDLRATNFNPLATVGDGSCVDPTPPAEVPGCRDLGATNYNPLATVDDSSCDFAVLGCMDRTATNYNRLATQDDGSCTDKPPHWTGSPCTDDSECANMPFGNTSCNKATGAGAADIGVCGSTATQPAGQQQPPTDLSCSTDTDCAVGLTCIKPFGSTDAGTCGTAPTLASCNLNPDAVGRPQANAYGDSLRDECDASKLGWPSVDPTPQRSQPQRSCAENPFNQLEAAGLFAMNPTIDAAGNAATGCHGAKSQDTCEWDIGRDAGKGSALARPPLAFWSEQGTVQNMCKWGH
jgi:hypothetical protein